MPSRVQMRAAPATGRPAAPARAGSPALAGPRLRALGADAASPRRPAVSAVMLALLAGALLAVGYLVADGLGVGPRHGRRRTARHWLP